MSFMADIKHDRNFWPLQCYYCLGAGHFSVRNLIWVALGRGGRLLEKTPTPPPHPLWVVFSSIWVIYLLIVPRKLPTNLTQVLVYREIKPTYFCDCCSFLLSKSCWFMVTALSTFLVWAINWFRAFLFSFAESSTLLTWSYEKENQSYGSIFRQIIDLVTPYYKVALGFSITWSWSRLPVDMATDVSTFILKLRSSDNAPSNRFWSNCRLNLKLQSNYCHFYVLEKKSKVPVRTLNSWVIFMICSKSDRLTWSCPFSLCSKASILLSVRGAYKVHRER